MKLKYRLTEKGLKKTKQYLNELVAYRKEILDAKLDTADDTPIPTVEDIESDIEMFEEDNEYFNCWGVTDEISTDTPLCLKYKEDYLETDKMEHQPRI